MRKKTHWCLGLVAVAVAWVGVLGWPVSGAAQTPTGRARAVKATTFGVTTVLADTGALAGDADARQASGAAGAVASLLSAETLHATAIGWPDQADAEASLSALNITVGGNGIMAGFVMARALAVLGYPGGGDTTIDALSINGLPVTVTGLPNQTIPIPGGRVVINEQQLFLPSGVSVNALHVIIDGVADVVIASATAGI